VASFEAPIQDYSFGVKRRVVSFILIITSKIKGCAVETYLWRKVIQHIPVVVQSKP